jgi:hypothetical protein
MWNKQKQKAGVAGLCTAAVPILFRDTGLRIKPLSLLKHTRKLRNLAVAGPLDIAIYTRAAKGQKGGLEAFFSAKPVTPLEIVAALYALLIHTLRI